jgi:hypothetical protein
MPKKGDWDYRKEGRNKTDRKVSANVGSIQINGHPVKPETAELVRQTAMKIADGATRKEAIEFISEKNGSKSPDYLGDIYVAALKYLRPSDDAKEGIAVANLGRLDRIIDKNIDKAPAVAIDAIKEQNKMAGITGGNVVAVKTNDDGTAEFVVKFGG